jgi:hypothetical protein
VKQYADLGATVLDALGRYATDVRNGTFPDQSQTYGMPAEELARFESQIEQPRRDKGFTKTLPKRD